MKILFVTTVSHTPSQKNLNHWQRVYFLSRAAELSILSVKGADFAVSAKPGSTVIQGAMPGKLGLLLRAALMVLGGQARAFDIVVTEPSLIGIVGFWFRLTGCRRWVVDVWDIPGRYHGRGRPLDALRQCFARSFLRAIYRVADRFIVSILPDYELRQFAISPERMLLCRNAIWLDGMMEETPVTEGAPLVLCMRTEHTREMGLDVLAAAVPRLERQFPKLRWLVVGRIPDHVAQQVASLRANPKIEFADFLEHDSLLERIHSAAVCVIPFHDVVDLRQTYPVKVLEYMALGKVIVASDLAGMRTLIDDGVNGLLFRPGDAGDLAEKLALVLTDDGLRSRLEKAALASVENYDCGTKNRRIISEMQNLLQPEKSRNEEIRGPR